ncbi:glycyl-radical enzyme activating protein [Alkalibacter rhizosphaerae]|uniref:Glycyl-radical enzyme activating protein n=1 Tax=Alkalibacter rhizosphaerae TaxID=2815577 RepID=A0A974XIP2_9FIRM|nr:glycyl-radical enzyme activating protein [Alkalibacter rhizosphaerae]QSX09078.1 glycyl-radical enzyme activating protein [Alkalibacter rhizosphaerae]
MTTGKIYDIQRFTVNDGPGIRTEVFLKGCPLTCLWCHSPESQAYESQLGLYMMRCIGIENCGKCLEACTHKAISEGEVVYSEVYKKDITKIKVDFDKCHSCFDCVEACRSKALVVIGEDKTVEETMVIIRKDSAYYKKSSGGVTISGGEALSQPKFTLELLKACKDEGLHTCLDTTGFAKWDTLEKMIPYVDLVLLDLKHMDSESSKELVGVPNEIILENAVKMAQSGVDIQIRVPIIPGHNDSMENLEKTGLFCQQLGDAVSMVQILPYHKLGTIKYERLAKPYLLEDLEPPSEERMEEIKAFLEGFGLKVKIH